MKKLILGLLIILTMIMFMGCSTIVSGTSQGIPINSIPSGADIDIIEFADSTNVSYRGVKKVERHIVSKIKTPYLFVASRKNNYKITITKDGYQEYSILTSKKLNAAIAGNIFFGGLIGAAVDASSGASNIILPERIDIILQPIVDNKKQDEDANK